MKQFVLLSAALLLLISCRQEKVKIVAVQTIDELFKNYNGAAINKASQENLEFWKDRTEQGQGGIINETKYAAALLDRYKLSGHIRDLHLSDSVLKAINLRYANKEAYPFLALTHNALMLHRFPEAGSFLEKAKSIGIKPYESLAASFDVDFELGRYPFAETRLKSFQSFNDYGYLFRHAKMAHYKGEIDTAISTMLKAAEVAGTNTGLKQAALSNAADLQLHNGRMKEAYALYLESIQLNQMDLHSLAGIGRIALLHDKNDRLAEKIFLFVQKHTATPGPLFNLLQVAEQRGDSLLQQKYAAGFAAIVSDTLYGNMYNKYLVQVYTGILNQPAKAVAISLKELGVRATPQTYAWYAWSLLVNNQQAEAYAIYKQHVSGKALEGMELYWMGKLMQAMDKGYNAAEFFKLARKNKYDLGPSMIKDLETTQ